MAAVGWPGDPEILPEKLRSKESPNDRRKRLRASAKGPSGGNERLHQRSRGNLAAWFRAGAQDAALFPGSRVLRPLN